MMITDIERISVCTDSYGHTHRLNGEISRGGQGVVFRTNVPNVVVKFELADDELVPPTENDKYMTLRFLPIPYGLHITMPQATLKDYSGYVMTMMSDMISFKSAFDEPVAPEERVTTPFTKKHDEKCNGFFSDYISSGGERRRLEAFMKSSALLAQLHSVGLVYCDYSQNNVFISNSKEFCHVWLIDADNLDYESNTLKSICYTPGLAAPEIVLFDQEFAQNVPEEERNGSGNSFGSDVYTFAVCLFKQLAGLHPFKGRKYYAMADEDDSYDNADANLSGGTLAYVADTEDDSNKGEFLRLDFVLTSELRDLFQQTFCQEGRDNYLSRPSMSEWALELARANDISLHCDTCGMDYINPDNGACPFCNASLPDIFTAVSHYAGQTKDAPALWEYCRELKDNTIELPLRLAHGYDADELDRNLLTLHSENGTFILRLDSMNANQKVTFSEDGNTFTSSNMVKTQKNTFYLMCEDETRRLNVLVTCRVKENGRH
ncbi:MAG: hypothetical protein IJQ08_08030 [Synergistaceae bacterium]|nr:hypothetical protein [Synergistaceae bacterium]